MAKVAETVRSAPAPSLTTVGSRSEGSSGSIEARIGLSGVQEGADQAAHRLWLQSPHVVDVRGVRDDHLRPAWQIRERLVPRVL